MNRNSVRSGYGKEAILQGYSAFRYLRQHRRARIHVDMTNRLLGVGALS